MSPGDSSELTKKSSCVVISFQSSEEMILFATVQDVSTRNSLFSSNFGRLSRQIVKRRFSSSSFPSQYKYPKLFRMSRMKLKIRSRFQSFKDENWRSTCANNGHRDPRARWRSFFLMRFSSVLKIRTIWKYSRSWQRIWIKVLMLSRASSSSWVKVIESKEGTSYICSAQGSIEPREDLDLVNLARELIY